MYRHELVTPLLELLRSVLSFFSQHPKCVVCVENVYESLSTWSDEVEAKFTGKRTPP